jgi:PPIC-type PPIASE domain
VLINGKVSIFIGFCFLFAIAQVGVAQRASSKKNGPSDNISFSSISNQEIGMLLEDVAKTNPKILERLVNDPAMRKQQIENLRQLLAFASQAQREGMALERANKQELENIRAEVLAVDLDHEINKGKDPLPPFGYITEQQLAIYWADKRGLRTHESEFQDFLNAKIAILKASDPANISQISADEIAQARDVFAKVRIYSSKYDQEAKAGRLAKRFIDKSNLQVKLQQAQFLSRLYSAKIEKLTVVPDEDITKYIAGHPEFDTTAKKAKAEKVLARAKGGEDFAALANEFSDDPGNRDENGELQGGLYKDVPEGKMVPPFERAALALEPGQIASGLVESDFGYHIIKLEKKGKNLGSPVQIYDVRHILITTTCKDPDDPGGREMPIRDYVRKVLETDKEDELISKIVAENNVRVPEDITVPAPANELPAMTVKKEPVKPKRPVTRRRH